MTYTTKLKNPITEFIRTTVNSAFNERLKKLFRYKYLNLVYLIFDLIKGECIL